MKKFLLFFLVLLIIAAGVVWLNPELQQQAKQILDNSGLGSNTTTFYKWQDQQGVWQYTQTPPPPGVEYETVEARSDVNVLPLPDKLAPK